VLCMIEEVPVAALEFGIPVDDVELLALLRWRSGSRGGGCAVVTVRRGSKGVGSPRLSIESHVASALEDVLATC
jgi:hypothetical protein